MPERQTGRTPAAEVEVPPLDLRACSVEEHCQELRRLRVLPFWWYLGQSRLFGNFSVPFQDREGVWWYQVKPGLCWPVDFLAPLPPQRAPLLRKSFLGYQHLVADEGQANSHLVINAITDAASYGPAAIPDKRRGVRKGFSACSFALLTAYDSDTFDECRRAWDDLVQRTGWKHNVRKADFDRTWRLLLDCPGVSVVVGRGVESGRVAGFLITKIIGDTAYVDTVASRTDLLGTHVNDAIIYGFVINARRLPGIAKAHFAIRSYFEPLERFKRGLGFAPVPFPALTRLHFPARLVLRTFFPARYRRMVGRFNDAG